MVKSWFPERGMCNLDTGAIHVHYTRKQHGSEMSEETRLRGTELEENCVGHSIVGTMWHWDRARWRLAAVAWPEP